MQLQCEPHSSLFRNLFLPFAGLMQALAMCKRRTCIHVATYRPPTWGTIPSHLLGHGSCSLRQAAYFCWLSDRSHHCCHATIAEAPHRDCIQVSMVSPCSENSTKENWLWFHTQRTGWQPISSSTLGKQRHVTIWCASLKWGLYRSVTWCQC